MLNNKLPFLNVLVEKTNAKLTTRVYRKPTDIGACMNAKGDCPDLYRASVIKGFLYRAKTLCSEKTEMLLEINRSKQILINNGYSNREVDEHIKKFLKNVDKVNTDMPKTVQHLYYRNYMSSGHREDEKALKEIIRTNIKTKEADTKLNVIIYYKSTKTSNLVLKNNPSLKLRDLARTHLVYDYNCQKDACNHLENSETTYTGVTTCQLSRRLSYHLQNGAIKAHYQNVHKSKITRTEIEEFTSIRYTEKDENRLSILEALIIVHEDPKLNRQDTGITRTLKLFGNYKPPTHGDAFVP